MVTHELVIMTTRRVGQGHYHVEGFCSCGEKFTADSHTGPVQARTNIYSRYRAHRRVAIANGGTVPQREKKGWCEGTGHKPDMGQATGWIIKPGAAYGTPTGVCPHCGRRVPLRGDGKLRSHVAELTKRVR